MSCSPWASRNVEGRAKSSGSGRRYSGGCSGVQVKEEEEVVYCGGGGSRGRVCGGMQRPLERGAAAAFQSLRACMRVAAAAAAAEWNCDAGMMCAELIVAGVAAVLGSPATAMRSHLGYLPSQDSRRHSRTPPSVL